MNQSTGDISRQQAFPPAVHGYEQLASVLQDAYTQASVGKGRERHANDQPFHQQRMQTISGLLDSDDGMAFQAIKKLTEGLQFSDANAREKELLGAIVYIAGIIVRQRVRIEADTNGR